MQYEKDAAPEPLEKKVLQFVFISIEKYTSISIEKYTILFNYDGFNFLFGGTLKK